MFNNDFDKLDDYIKAHSEPENELLKELDRQTHLKILRPRMLSGHIQGRVLSMISNMINPQNILEIGTYTGYSTICLSEGLREGGRLITCDVNDEIETFTRSFLDRSQRANQIDYRIQDARELLKNNNIEFDLVFIDGDKRQYPEYYELVLPHVRQGGYLIADNILWSGKVIEDNDHPDEYTLGVLSFNEMVQNDNRVQNVIFPFRDGLMVIRKI
ncbi:MAG: methyltransferase [Salinivirgaceae bacterium]|nr:MAG: methyltransferase [Salinivirgaceae bacterium]